MDASAEKTKWIGQICHIITNNNEKFSLYEEFIERIFPPVAIKDS